MTKVQESAGSVAYRIGHGDLNLKMLGVLQKHNLAIIHGTYVRLACEKISDNNQKWWDGISKNERSSIATILFELEDEEAAVVAEAVREGWT